MANLINEAKRFQKLAGIITESQILSEAVKLDVLMKDGKPNSEILVVPNKFYSDKEELDANTMRPFQIKKEEGRKDMMVFTVVGRKAENQQFPIEGDEVADIILYNDAKSKLKESELNEDLKAEDIKVGGFYVAQMPTSNDGKERVDVKVRVVGPDKSISPDHFVIEPVEDKRYINPESKLENEFSKGKHYGIEAKFLKPDMRESLDIDSIVNEALKSVRK
jgi:hypothetical protein